MFRISNIEKINYYSRELGNKVISKVAKCIQENISENYIFVRYIHKPLEKEKRREK